MAGKIHQEIQESEDDNVGVESAHKSEEAVETGVHLVQEGYRSHKLKPYRKAAQAERQLEKANINVLYQKSLQDNPRLRVTRCPAGSRSSSRSKSSTPLPNGPHSPAGPPPVPPRNPARQPKRSKKRPSRPVPM